MGRDIDVNNPVVVRSPGLSRCRQERKGEDRERYSACARRPATGSSRRAAGCSRPRTAAEQPHRGGSRRANFRRVRRSIGSRRRRTRTSWPELEQGERVRRTRKRRSVPSPDHKAAEGVHAAHFQIIEALAPRINGSQRRNKRCATAANEEFRIANLRRTTARSLRRDAAERDGRSSARPRARRRPRSRRPTQSS